MVFCSASQRPGGFFPCLPKRFIVAGFVALGILIQFFTKVCLSVAIVAMVKSSSSDDNDTDSGQTDADKCPGKLNSTSDSEEGGDFEWDETMQGFILAAFYYGYITTQLLGGRLSELFGAKLVMGCGICSAGVLALLSELAADWHEGAFATVRILQGMALNNGLKDQAAALKWVQENIKYFGGNPDDVTIFGQSAGGASVHYHLLSPKTQGLFHRAIAQSGSALNDWAFAEPSYAHDRATILAEYLGYGLNSADDIFEVLQTADVKDIIHYQDISVTDHDIIHDVNIPFVPTFEDSGEDAFITQAPLDIIKNGEFKQIPYITGVTSEEGKYFTSDVLLDPTLWPQLRAHFESLAVPEVLGLSMKSNESLAILDQVKQLYFGNESVSANTLEQYVHLKSDREIVTGVHRALKLQLQIGSAPTYFYVFSYFGELSLSERNHYNYTFPGAAHADDMEYLMTPSVLTVTADKHPEEVKVIHYLTQMWTNFAKYGDPTRNMDVTWYPITDEHFTYINIDSELSIEDLNGFETERMEFWDEIYGNIDSLS